MKHLVHYEQLYLCEIGKPAIVSPLDHPVTHRVSNTQITRTSPVVSLDPATGAFETHNSSYRKASAELIAQVREAQRAVAEAAAKVSA